MDTTEKSEEVAVGIFSFNRPEYLQEVLGSLEANRSIMGMDCYLFQDGSVNQFSGRMAAEEKDVQECIKIWEKSSLPRKSLIARGANIGMAANFFRAAEFLFDERAYEKVLFFEDDLVVNSNYVRSLSVLLDQFQDDETVGVVMCHGGTPRTFSDEERKANLRQIKTGAAHLWGWATWKDRWKKVKPAFLDYYRFVRDRDPNVVKSKEIVEFFVSEGMKMKSTSQDTGFYYALVKNGLVTLNTILHRGKYIGAKGWHMNQTRYDEIGYAKVALVDDVEDAAIDRFEGYDPRTAERYLKTNFYING
jgi:hypothetical protein